MPLELFFPPPFCSVSHCDHFYSMSDTLVIHQGNTKIVFSCHEHDFCLQSPFLTTDFNVYDSWQRLNLLISVLLKADTG